MPKLLPRVRQAALWFALALLSSSCTAQKPAISATTHPNASRRLAIVLFGFFNNENPRSFEPKLIVYATMDPETVHRALAREAEAFAWSRPIRALSWSEMNALYDRDYPEKDREVATERLQAVLEVLRGMAMNEVSALDKEKKLQAPLPPSTGLVADDRILLVIGLETCTPGGDPHLLRSVLGCFWFSGDGPYLAGAIQPYDFAHFGEKEMVALTAKCFPKRGVK